MAITAGMVKELREMTGAGMMDCKKALQRQTAIWMQLSSSSERTDRQRLRK